MIEQFSPGPGATLARRLWFGFCVLGIVVVAVFVQGLPDGDLSAIAQAASTAAGLTGFTALYLSGVALGRRAQRWWVGRNLIEFVGSDSIAVIVTGSAPGVAPTTPSVMLRAVFRNQSRSVDLDGLNADVRFYTLDRDLVLRMEGRWADHERHSSGRPELIDLSPGDRAFLDIVMRDYGDSSVGGHGQEATSADMFAFNTESFHRTADGKLEERRLEDTGYIVEVELTGGGFRKTHTLRLGSGESTDGLKDFYDPYVELWKP